MSQVPPLKFRDATLDDVPAIAALQNAAAGAWPADAIRLDAYDAKAGAGGFYTSCGYEERGRVVYRNAPLVYFELLLPR